MSIPQQWETVIGLPAVDHDGNKIGKVGQIYIDDATGQPEWVTVSTGLFGTRESFAPLYGSAVRDGQMVLAVSRQLVQDAPNVENDGHLSESQLSGLHRHYAGSLRPAQGPEAGEAGDDRYAGDDRIQDAVAGSGRSSTTRETGQAGPGTDAMTRSEERLRVGTEQVETGRARLRKYVVTEQVTKTVPVSHEEVRVEREPITEANRDAALSGPEISEQEHEVTLHAERPVVEKEAVPVERVRLATDTVTGEQEVSEQVRKEQIDEPETGTGPRASGR